MKTKLTPEEFLRFAGWYITNTPGMWHDRIAAEGSVEAISTDRAVQIEIERQVAMRLFVNTKQEEPLFLRKPSLFLFDADGTLRRCTVPGQPCPNRDGEWEIIPGVREILANMTFHSFGIISNQAGVALGYLTEDTAKNLLYSLASKAFGQPPAPGAIQVCPHAPKTCSCRKPSPEMLQRVMRLYGYGPASTIYIGDQEDDRLAATAAGCSFVWAWEFFGKSREEWIALVERGAS